MSCRIPKGEDGFVSIFLSMRGKKKLRCCCHRTGVRQHPRTVEVIQQTDSLRCGEATAGQTVHRTVCLDRPFESVSKEEKDQSERIGLFLVGEDGFEPSKRNAADLQSVPFGHSGTPPYVVVSVGLVGAGRRTRTPDLLITNQLLYRLSYTGSSNRTVCIIARKSDLSRGMF